MWTQWIYVQMPGQDLEYYQIEPDPKHPPERGQAYLQRLQSLLHWVSGSKAPDTLLRLLKSLAIL